MKANALICLADGCEETEAVTVFDLLVRGGINVTTASIKDDGELKIVCSRGITLLADKTFDEVINQSFDIIILPGGVGGAENYRDNTKLIEKIRQQHSDNRIVAAICASPAVVFQHHNLFPEAKMTGYPSTEPMFNEQYWSGKRVCYDEEYRVLTSQGPATSIDFALKIVELLVGSQKAAEVANQLVLPVGIYNYQ